MNLPQVKKFFTENFGPRCKDYDLDCYTCKRYQILDELTWIYQDATTGKPKEIKRKLKNKK